MFKGIDRSVNRKLAVLKNSAEFSATVRATVKLLYRKDAPVIRDAVFESAPRRASVAVAGVAGRKTLTRDRELLRAALRREGFDVKELVVS